MFCRYLYIFNKTATFDDSFFVLHAKQLTVIHFKILLYLKKKNFVLIQLFFMLIECLSVTNFQFLSC